MYGSFMKKHFYFRNCFAVFFNNVESFFIENLKQPVDEHIKKLSSKVRVIRNSERSGLIKSRLAGAEASIGDVLIFLDSHCEATPGWIEPLLARIKEKR